MVGSKIEGFILASQDPDNVQINRVDSGGICRDIGERLALSTRSLTDLASMALPSFSAMRCNNQRALWNM
jgi:hypothetical protein